MSMFGDDNFRSDVFENLDWICSEDIKEQVEFIHSTIISIVENGLEHVNEDIGNFIKERNLTKNEVLTDLGEVYFILVEYRLCSDD